MRPSISYADLPCVSGMDAKFLTDARGGNSVRVECPDRKYIFRRQFRHTVALPNIFRTVLASIGDIAAHRVPSQVSCPWICWIAVIVSDLMLRAWARPVKCLTDKLVNIKGLFLWTVKQCHIGITVFLKPGPENFSDRGTARFACAAHIPFIADFIRPAFDWAPFHALIYLALIIPATAKPQFTTQYDVTIQSSVRAYWPDFPQWLWWKSQLIAESGLNPNAVSPVGAVGLAQFMGPTFQEVSRELGWSGISANQADASIEAGSYYMAKLRHQWTSNRPMTERHYLAISAYNAGTGNILKAQSLCHNALLWAQISPCLPQVTGTLAKQTVDYVSRIKMWRAELE